MAYSTKDCKESDTTEPLSSQGYAGMFGSKDERDLGNMEKVA